MKAINEPQWRNGTNAWGASTYTAEQLFQVEQSDIGMERHNYRGHGHSTYKFKQSDVERVIAVYTDKSNWTCWVFSSGEKP